MKRFILLLLAFYAINCTLNECINEGDTSKCYSHEVDVDNFTCHLVHYDSSSIKNRFDEDELFYLLADKCIPYPDLAQDQKTFWDLNHGNGKEEMSIISPFESEMTSFLFDPEKESYSKDEDITVKPKEFSSTDMKTIKSKNTCMYKFLGKSIEANKLVNTEESKECYNVYQFPDHENLINCGHATINFSSNGKNYEYKTCFFIPDYHLDKHFEKYFKVVYVENFVGLLANAVRNELDTEQTISAIKSHLKEGTRRKLQSTNNLNYELIVEDKYGKKYKYSGDKDEPELIEEGMQGDKEYGSNHYVDNVDDSKMTLINYKLLLLLASLIFI